MKLATRLIPLGVSLLISLPTAAGTTATAPDPAADATTVGEREFSLRDGTWVDDGYRKGMKEKRIEGFSAEFFDLASRGDDLADALALGERVVLVVGGKAYTVVPGAHDSHTACEAAIEKLQGHARELWLNAELDRIPEQLRHRRDILREGIRDVRQRYEWLTRGPAAIEDDPATRILAQMDKSLERIDRELDWHTPHRYRVTSEGRRIDAATKHLLELLGERRSEAEPPTH